MKSFGSLLVILGLGSFVLNMLDMEFKLLAWIDNWGPTTGIAIRGGLIVVGLALWLMGRKREAAQPAQS
jgi:prolipoprotein diacylglyceryltransferase